MYCLTHGAPMAREAGLSASSPEALQSVSPPFQVRAGAG